MKKEIFITLLFFLFNFHFSQVTISYDSSYGDAGKVFPFNNMDYSIMKVIQTKDNNLIYISRNKIFKTYLDGSFNKSFGTDGVLSVENTEYCYISDIVELTDENLIVIYQLSDSSFKDIKFYVKKISKNGIVDSTFNNNIGRREVILGSILTDYARIIKIINNKILILGKGFHVSGSGSQIIMMQLNLNGDLDLNFGNSGKVYTSLFESDLGDVFLDKNNYLYLAYRSNNKSISIAKFDFNGNLFTAFGNNGITTVNVVSNYDDIFPQKIKLTNSGKIFIGCQISSQSSSYDPKIQIVKLNNNGLLDTSLNSSGFYAFNLVPNSWDYFRDIIVNEDESFHVIGYSSGFILSFISGFITKNKKNGKLDFNFNGNGYHHTNFKEIDDSSFSGGIRQKDGKILLYGGSGFFNVTAGTVRIIDDTFLSIVDFNQYNKQSSIIYPNPVSNFLYIINNSNKIKINDKYEIIDINGRIILNGVIGNEYKIFIENLSKGVYFLVIKDYKEKFLKL